MERSRSTAAWTAAATRAWSRYTSCRRIVKCTQFLDSVLNSAYGWRRAFEKHCRVDSGGHTGLESVLVVPPPRRDRMESFWLAESLKYLWLLFSDDGAQTGSETLQRL